jgi:hypothetical protein
MNVKEEFIICPCCSEEALVTLTRGFNIVNCPSCEYFVIVFLDETGKAWTREPGVLEADHREE